MKRSIHATVAAVFVVTSWASSARAEGLFLYEPSAGRFTPLVVRNQAIGMVPDVAGPILPTARAPVAYAGACGGAYKAVGAFTLKLATLTEKTGIVAWGTDPVYFGYVDAQMFVREGESTPVGGFFAAFTGNPTIAMQTDTTPCRLHVIFRAKIVGFSASADTMIFDYVFALDDLSSPVATHVVAQEGTYIGGGYLLDLPADLNLAATTTSAGGAIDLFFSAKVAGTGISTDNDTGISGLRFTEALTWFGSSFVAREGVDIAPWAPGFYYDEFKPKQPLAVVSDPDSPFQSRVVFRAKAKGALTATDTAVVMRKGTGVMVTVAAEGSAVPTFAVGTVYGDFPDSTPTAVSSYGALFLNRFAGTDPRRCVMRYKSATSTVDASVLCNGHNHTVIPGEEQILTAGQVSFTMDNGGAIGAATRIKGFTNGLFFGTLTQPFGLLSWQAQSVQAPNNYDSTTDGPFFTVRMP